MSLGHGEVPGLSRTIISGIARTNFYDAPLEDIIEPRDKPPIENKYNEGIRPMQNFTDDLMTQHCG
jgi:hypothetical protein